MREVTKQGEAGGMSHQQGGQYPRPYDNVLFPPSASDSLFNEGHFQAINLIEEMRDDWQADFDTAYPGAPEYVHNSFRARYSDHHPIRFKIMFDGDDD